MFSSDPLSPTPTIPSNMKTPENTEYDPDDPQPAEEGDTKWDTPLINCTSQA